MTIFFMQYIFPLLSIVFIIAFILINKNHKRIAIILVSIITFIISLVLASIFVPKVIRGEKLIKEINNYYEVNKEFPKFDSLDQLDKPDTDYLNLLNVYKKAFPDEDVKVGGFNQQYTQPYYQDQNFGTRYYYIIYYKIFWSNFNSWDWIFEYDSSVNKWSISYIQY